jgi:hypothetical protein
MWNLTSFCLETVLVSVQDRCTVLHQTYHQLRNHFGRLMVLLAGEAQVKAHFALFGDSANLDAS